MKEKIIRNLKYIIPILILTAFVLLEIYSRSAAMLFNHAMQEQTMLRGTISVEKLAAHLSGHVFFENLEWKDPEGNKILSIPDGSFRVNLLDVVTQRFSSTTIKELTLNRAAISVRLTEDMKWDIIAPTEELLAKSEEKPKEKPKAKKNDRAGKSEEELLAAGEKKRQEQRQELEQGWHNFNREGKKLAMNLVLNSCRVEVLYRNRHYLMESVNLKTDIDTDRSLYVRADTGPFDGTMIGNGITFSGSIDFKKQAVPICDFAVFVDSVDPSSLGFGMDIHDKMTLSVHFTGEFSHPVGQGTIHMDRLRIPSLDFSNVDGTLRYEDAMVQFDDVTAAVYEGTLKAKGWYNIDSRYYHIDGYGENLKARRALPGQKLHCKVKLEIHVHSQGSVQTTSYEGSFSSGEGRFKKIHFHELRGRFHDVGRDLDFYDVVIDFGGVKAVTDILSVHSGKLTLAPISVLNNEGQVIVTYYPDSNELEEKVP